MVEAVTWMTDCLSAFLSSEGKPCLELNIKSPTFPLTGLMPLTTTRTLEVEDFTLVLEPAGVIRDGNRMRSEKTYLSILLLGFNECSMIAKWDGVGDAGAGYFSHIACIQHK